MHSRSRMTTGPRIRYNLGTDRVGFSSTRQASREGGGRGRGGGGYLDGCAEHVLRQEAGVLVDLSHDKA